MIGNETASTARPVVVWCARARPDAFHHDAPDARDESAANRKDHERIGRPDGETDDAESCLKRPSRATDKGEAQMQDGRTDKEAKGDQNRHEDYENNRAHADAQDAGERVVIAHEAE